METLRTIRKVRPFPNATLEIHWEDQDTVTINLQDLRKKPAFKTLRGDSFHKVRVGEWGHSIEWPDGTALGADELWRRTLAAKGRQDALKFLDWRMRHGLSLAAAAEALGLSRRMVAYYSSGARPVPRTVLLACTGWERIAAAA